jgi:hypothetical protein
VSEESRGRRWMMDGWGWNKKRHGRSPINCRRGWVGASHQLARTGPISRDDRRAANLTAREPFNARAGAALNPFGMSSSGRRTGHWFGDQLAMKLASATLMRTGTTTAASFGWVNSSLAASLSASRSVVDGREGSDAEAFKRCGVVLQLRHGLDDETWTI